MSLQEAIAHIVANYDELIKLNPKYSKPEIEAVWCAESNTAGSYEVDEEWIGVRLNGDIAWAYASGCSCWNGGYDEEHKSTIKELTLKHYQHLPEDWEKAIILFAETHQFQDI